MSTAYAYAAAALLAEEYGLNALPPTTSNDRRTTTARVAEIRASAAAAYRASLEEVPVDAAHNKLYPQKKVAKKKRTNDRNARQDDVSTRGEVAPIEESTTSGVSDIYSEFSPQIERIEKSIASGTKSRNKQRGATKNITKLAKKVTKNKKDRESYMKLSPDKKKVKSARNRKYKDFTKEQKDRRNALRRKARAYERYAEAHNKLYPHDKIADKQCARESTLVMKKMIKVDNVPPRVKHMYQDINTLHDVVSTGGLGYFAENKDGSIVNVMKEVHRILGYSPKNRKMNTLELGSGLGRPSTVFSQYLFDHGLAIGVELDPNLQSNALHNLKLITLKGVHNVKNGCFEEDSVEQNGELKHVVPPRMMLLQADIVSGLATWLSYFDTFD